MVPLVSHTFTRTTSISMNRSSMASPSTTRSGTLPSEALTRSSSARSCTTVAIVSMWELRRLRSTELGMTTPSSTANTTDDPRPKRAARPTPPSTSHSVRKPERKRAQNDGRSPVWGRVSHAMPALLPLDRRRGLGRHVVGDPVDPGDLVDDPGGDALQHLVREPGPVGGHGVLRRDRPHDQRVGVGALVTLYPHRADRRKHPKGLPDLPVEPGAPDLLENHGIGAPEDFEAFRGDLTDDPHGESGSGEGLPPHDLLGKAQFLP